MLSRNLQLLARAAGLLRPLLPELVFVGGCTTALLITDKAAPEVRATKDVDAIAEISSYPDYVRFSDRLRALGFDEDTSDGAPVCRWRQQDTILDVMPLDESILGFSNRWYKPAMECATEHELEGDLRVRVVTAPYFCATKLEAFKGRGARDYLSSHDLEDFITVIDGRAEIIDEIRMSSADLRAYAAREVQRLLTATAFRDALPGYLLPDSASQARISSIIGRLSMIARP